MKMENLPFDLGIIGIKRGRNITKEELEELAMNTLSLEPLGKIFRVSYIGIGKESIKEVFEKKIRRIALIGERLSGRYEKKENLHLIYSNFEPSTLSHELGHSLGLSHPEICDNYCLRDELVNFMMMAICRDCEPQKRKDLMACDIENGSKNYIFSEEDLKRLNDWYLCGGK